MTHRNTRAGLEKWFVDVDELLAAQREHAISPSTVPSARTEPATWTMTLGALHRDLVGLIDLLVNSPGRWIFILDAGLPGGRYVQLLLCEDGSIVAEASSNNFLEGSDRLSTEEEEALVTIGWSAPRLPAKPNWWATQATIHPDTEEVARLVLGTFGGAYGLCATDMITGRVFSTPRRGSTPASRAAHPAQFLAPSKGVGRTGPYRWSDAFRRSRLSPAVFVVAKAFVEPVRQVLDANGVQFVGQGHMFDNAYGSAVLLDGLLISLRTYGFPAGQLSSGWRVLGYHPMRLLCLLMGLEQPRRALRGEHVVATREDLLEALAWQHDEPPDQIQERARQGLGVADRVGLLVLVRELFGEEYLPTPLSRDLKAALPAIKSQWAFSGFSRLDEEELSAVGIGVEEAIAWKRLACSRPSQIREMLAAGFSKIDEWATAGFDPALARGYLREGQTLCPTCPCRYWMRAPL